MRTFLVGAAMLVGLSACSLNAQFVSGVDRGYGHVYSTHQALLDEKARLTKKALAEDVGAEKADAIFKKYNLAEFDADTVRIRKQGADELKNLIEEGKKKIH